jgi:hypothetical protein
VEQALCARLSAGTGAVTEDMAAAARRHRVHLLLARGLSTDERRTAVGQALVRELTMASALHAWHDASTRELLEALAASEIAVLILKGTGLAHSLYPEPHLRPCLDVDLLVRPDALEAAERVLAAQGWSHPPERDAELSEPQRHYAKNARGTLAYHVDLHWKIANPRIFADATSFEALDAGAVPVPPLGAGARTLRHIDALLVACVHRVAHHGDALHLLWLWDIHLLMERLSEDDRDQFIALAGRTRMRAVCARGLRIASLLFHTKNADETARRLESSAVGERPEPSSAFLGGTSTLFVAVSNMSGLPWRDRVRLASEHLFPSVEYMMARYPHWPKSLLPLAYIGRIAHGAPRWFIRQR